jgi:hypothetical protein
MLLTSIPEVTMSDLEGEVRALHDAEREALLAAGSARLRGLPGAAARAELRRVREELEVRYAAQHVLETLGGVL